MPLSPALATWLGEQGQDAVHASRAGLHQASDTAILDHARREDRIVVTADLDYPRLLALTRAEGPGLIPFRGGAYSEAEGRDRLARVLGVIPPEDLPTSVIVIEKSRLRRTRLPLEPRS